MEFAKASGVEIEYIVSDVVEWDCRSHLDTFDIVLMELGFLHYFIDLNPLAGLIHSILRPGGKLILHEFHPINKKCPIESDGDRWILTGDYFSSEVFKGQVPFRIAFPEDEADALPPCHYRYWQIGEIVTTISSAGMIIETLTENPHKEPHPLPASFTLVARKS